MHSAADLVEEGTRLVAVDVARAVLVAEQAVRQARAEKNAAVESRALRLRGLAGWHHGSEGALDDLRRAVRAGLRSGDRTVEAEARVTLAGTLAILGSARAALRELDRAATLGHEPPRAVAQRGLVLHSLGRYEESAVVLAAALGPLAAAEDHDGVLAVLINRGAGHLRRGAGAAAETDLTRAVDLARHHDRPVDAAFAEANLASALALQGRVPDALRAFRSAEAALRTTGTSVASLMSMRAELLVSVRLLSEARDVASAALSEFVSEGNAIGEADLQLLLAQIALRERRDAAAREHARAGAASYSRMGRADLGALARLWAGLAGAVPRDLDRLVRDVAATGWPGPSIEARILAFTAARGERARVRGRARLAEATRWRGNRWPADLRARSWYAEALLRAVDGDRGGSLRAALRGLDILDDHAVSLPATDLRAHVAGHRVDLVRHGLGLALADGSARAVLGWAERGRATHLLHRTVLPPQEPRVAERMSELRGVVRDLYEARSTGAGQSAQERLRVRQTQLEREVRDLSRQGTSGDPASRPDRAARSVDLADALGDRALVEYVVHDGALHAVTLVDRRCRLHHLGDLTTVAGLVERVPFAVQRMIRAARSPGGASAAQTLLADAGRRLDALLLEPLREIAGRDLVVVPTGALQATAWSVLPSCHGRPVTVAPSATVWLAASSRPTATGPAVVAAGPRLASAAQEARAVADLYGVDPLVDPDATVAAVSAALPGASVAHLATHGRLSAENPLFSHLLLSDGPLVVYDLERLESLPHTVVLAACDSGRHVAPAGDELLGLGAAFLAGGTAQLVASVVPVPDAETATLMTALHEGLVAGLPPAVALARAQTWLAGAGPVAAATAAGFVCVGAGYVPLPRPAVREGFPDPHADAVR